MSSKVRVTSEVGRLRHVIVHTPGEELLAVTPSNRGDYLYDDIIDLEFSREEHRRFAAILSRFAKVSHIENLLEEALEVPEAREFLIKRSEEITANRALRSEVSEWSAAEIVQRFLQGWRSSVGPFTHALGNDPYVLPPLPNVFFTRDAAIVVGEKVVISSMRFPARWPEEVIPRTIFGFHPDFGQPGILYDGSDERRFDHMLEGGDVHPVREDVVVVGLSERTSDVALDALTKILFEQSPVTDVIAVVLPQGTTAIHLDMVWTMVDTAQAVAHQPMFEGPKRVPVLHVHKGRASTQQHDTIFAALDSVGLKVEPIWCGGETPESREREQWASGCNFLAVGPGQVVSYARNEGTLRNMERAGYRVIASEALLLGDEVVAEGERVAITFYGSELVRGGGGPRCMTCPVLRDDLV